MPQKHRPQKKHITKTVLSDIRNTPISNIASSSFKAWYTNWPWVILSVLVDFLFLVITSLVIGFIQLGLLTHLEALMRMAGEATGGLMNIYNQTADVTAGAFSLTQNMDFQFHLNKIFNSIALMVLTTFIFWLLFQALSWYIAHRMSTDRKQRQSYLTYWKNFTLQSIPLYIIFILLSVLYIKLLFEINMSIKPLFSQGFLDFIFIILMIALTYFGSLCYSLTDRSAWKNIKQCLAYGTRKFTRVIQSIILIVIVFLIIHFIAKIPFIAQDPLLLLIMAPIFLLPAAAYARIVFFKTAQVYWKEKKKK
jgi:hypothetical protein